MKEDKLMSMKEVQEYLGLGRDKTYALFRLRDFPAIKFNKSAVIYRNDLDSWLKEHRGMTVYL
ncbi:MAG: helix-turn-helix transcriptional regulator [Agathobacter sp.]